MFESLLDRCLNDKKIKSLYQKNETSKDTYIDPVQKWLPLNYSFVRIQNSLTDLVRENKFLPIFISETRLVRLF